MGRISGFYSAGCPVSHQSKYSQGSSCNGNQNFPLFINFLSLSYLKNPYQVSVKIIKDFNKRFNSCRISGIWLGPNIRILPSGSRIIRYPVSDLKFRSGPFLVYGNCSFRSYFPSHYAVPTGDPKKVHQKKNKN